MDSFTQILLGIATAELCAGQKLQRKTFLYGAILGTIPDLDILVGQFMNSVQAVTIHRGLSHSLFFFMWLSPILGWLISKIEKQKIDFRTASNMVFWCLLTHILLDMFTSWGTQIFWPSKDRIALKTIFVIDPLYTLPLLIALIVAWRKPTFEFRKKHILRGIYISSVYLAITCGLKLFALKQFKNALQQQNITYTDLIVKPTAFNCILWNANVATQEACLLADYSLFDSQPITFKSYQKNNHLTQKLKGNPDFETLKQVSEGWYIVTQKDNHYYFNDLRFGLLNTDAKQPQFAFSYILKNQDGSLKAYEVPKEKRDGKVLMKSIFQRIQGN